MITDGGFVLFSPQIYGKTRMERAFVRLYAECVQRDPAYQRSGNGISESKIYLSREILEDRRLLLSVK